RAHLLRDAGPVQQTSEELARGGRVMQIISASRECPDQQCFALARGVFDGCNVAVRIPAGRSASRQSVLLQEKPAVDFLVAHGHCELVKKVWSELDIALPRAEQTVEAEVGLHGPGFSAVAEV